MADINVRHMTETHPTSEPAKNLKKEDDDWMWQIIPNCNWNNTEVNIKVIF